MHDSLSLGAGLCCASAERDAVTRRLVSSGAASMYRAIHPSEEGSKPFSHVKVFLYSEMKKKLHVHTRYVLFYFLYSTVVFCSHVNIYLPSLPVHCSCQG